MDSELKPCPFCGEPPVTMGSGEGQRGLMIECITPGCVGPHTSYYNHKAAIAAWNHRALEQREAATPPRNVPGGWVLVPRVPTEAMVVAGFESEPDPYFSKPDAWKAYEAMTGCRQAAHRAKLCWEAMLAAAPSGEVG